jgi:2-polyprenyl-3-methyl-5-hydroxy-6-metoxy-1,4-benzoquinol methylase
VSPLKFRVEENGMARPAWKDMYAHRVAVRRRFPDPLGLPVVRRPESLLASRLPAGARLLDVGAGDGTLKGKLGAEGTPVDYVSVDPGGGADHSSLEEVEGVFDAASLLEVVEHLDPEGGFDLVREAVGRLKPGGLLFLSTPNVFKPGQFFKDVTHCTPYSWEELGALCTAAGTSLEGLYRVYNASLLSRFLHRGPLWPMHRFLGLDCARSVMAVGRKG